MAKGKKKHSKKDKVSDDLLDAAALSIKKFRKVTKQITKLSTGQKLVGGIALLAAGLTYLAKNQPPDADSVPAEPHADSHALPEAHADEQEETADAPTESHPHRKSRKSVKAK